MSTNRNQGCRSSVVEHLIGNEEVSGSIPLGSTAYTPKVVARFWSRVTVPQPRLDKDYCWNWRASIDRHGYGQFKVFRDTSPQRAHRVAWSIFHGPIPEGLMILHSCHNRKCCNPAHLRHGTHIDNMKDMADAGRAWRGGPQKKGAV